MAAYGPFVSRAEALSEFYAVAGRPLLISEFSIRAADSGLPNSWPPIYPTYETQADRAEAYERIVEEWQGAGYVVGQHWFSYTDDPPGGRFDGEDSNFGLVDNNDDPWQLLVDRMALVHARAPHHHYVAP